MNAADAYAARIDAVNAQGDRLRDHPPESDQWAAMTGRFRMDPRRPLDANLAALAEFVQPKDVLVDVGGGAGRVSLPLAGRCGEVVNVEPSPSMAEAFLASAVEAGITNARVERAEWLEATASGDISLVCNVTYFVQDIVRFIERLQERSRRRVLITLWSVPPPNRNAGLFRVLTGEEQEPVPGHAELLAVLWEMGLLPDVRMLPGPFRTPDPALPTREAAVEWALDQLNVRRAPARERLEAQFDALFQEDAIGFRPLWRRASREMIITWPTNEG